jgi:hypothetical protein
MDTIPITEFRDNIQKIIQSVLKSQKPVWISDEGKLLVKISPAFPEKTESWLGCMRSEGRILGDIVSPAESEKAWNSHCR